MCIGNTRVLIISDNPYKWLCLTGLTTSLLNHYYKPKIRFLQILDRSVMVSCATVCIYYNVDYLYLLYISIFLYFLSKLTKYTIFHALSHCIVCIFHNKMLM